MKALIFGLTIVSVASFTSSAQTGGADRVASLAPGPVRAITPEPGVVPPGTSLVVRANDTVSTDKAHRGTIYDASVAEDILDQHGTVLIPKESAVELVVRSLPYLGPGGVGMTELALSVRAVTINGMRYPVETETGAPNAGGVGGNPQAVTVLSSGAAADQALTNGRRVNVPTKTLLAFQIEDPIRLKGYRP